MTFVIVILVIAVILFVLHQLSNNQAKQEVQSQGGLRNIFFNLDIALGNSVFYIYSDSISILEYHKNIDQFSFIKFTITKSIDVKQPYSILMKKVTSGIITEKTIPWIIREHYSVDEYLKIIQEMGQSLK